MLLVITHQAWPRKNLVHQHLKTPNCQNQGMGKSENKEKAMLAVMTVSSVRKALEKLATYHSWFAIPFSRNEPMPINVPRYLHLDLSKHVMRNISMARTWWKRVMHLHCGAWCTKASSVPYLLAPWNPSLLQSRHGPLDDDQVGYLYKLLYPHSYYFIACHVIASLCNLRTKEQGR